MPPEGFIRAEKSGREIMRELFHLSIVKEVREHDLFRWLLKFDNDFGVRDRDAKESAVHSMVDLLTRWQSNPSPRLERDTLDYLVAQLAAPILQRSYESAVYIGRKWKDAETRIRWAKSAISGDNLAITVDLNLADAKLEAGATEATRAAIEETIEVAAERARASLAEAKLEWAEWLANLGPIREQLNQHPGRGITGFPLAALASIIHRQLLAEAKTPGYSQESKSFQVALGLLLIASWGGWPFHPGFHLRAWEEFPHRLLDLVERYRYADADRLRLAFLEEQISSGDPFEAYTPLRRPIDDDLLRLLQEHTLPSGGFSHYLRNWLDSLDSDFDELTVESLTNARSVESAARWADCEMKRDMSRSRSRSKSTRARNVNDALRDLFADRIEAIATWHLSDKREGGATSEAWNIELFSTFVKAVWERLQKQGYHFGPIDNDRLEEVWKRKTA